MYIFRKTNTNKQELITGYPYNGSVIYLMKDLPVTQFSLTNEERIKIVKLDNFSRIGMVILWL